MPATQLQQRLQELRDQLAGDLPLTDEERGELTGLMAEIEERLGQELAEQSAPSLADGFELMVERFEVSHPALADSLRQVMQALVSLGI